MKRGDVVLTAWYTPGGVLALERATLVAEVGAVGLWRTSPPIAGTDLHWANALASTPEEAYRKLLSRLRLQRFEVDERIRGIESVLPPCPSSEDERPCLEDGSTKRCSYGDHVVDSGPL